VSSVKEGLKSCKPGLGWRRTYACAVFGATCFLSTSKTATLSKGQVMHICIVRYNNSHRVAEVLHPEKIGTPASFRVTGLEGQNFATRKRLDICVVLSAVVGRLEECVLVIGSVCREREILDRYGGAQYGTGIDRNVVICSMLSQCEE